MRSIDAYIARGASAQSSARPACALKGRRLLAAAASAFAAAAFCSCASTAPGAAGGSGGWDQARQAADIRINAVIARGDYDEAVRLADSLEAAGINDHRVLGQKALALGMLGKDEEAVSDFEAALLKEYNNCENHLNLAVLLMKTGKTGRALTEFAEARRFCPEEKIPLICRNEAVGAIKQDRSADALKKVEEGLGIDPGDPYLLGLKGMLVAEVNPVMAESLLTASSREGEVNADFLYQTGIVFLKTGRPSLAVMPLAKAHGMDPGARNITLDYAEALSRTGKYSEAESVLRREDEAGKDEEVSRRLAAVLMKQKKYAGALEIYRKLPETPEVLDRMAMALHNTGRSEEALKLQRKAVAAKPDWPGGLIDLAVILGAIGELDEAESVLEKVLMIDPDNATAIVNLQKLRDAREAAGKR